jgi:hypothetical protein
MKDLEGVRKGIFPFAKILPTVTPPQDTFRYKYDICVWVLVGLLGLLLNTISLARSVNYRGGYNEDSEDVTLVHEPLMTTVEFPKQMVLGASKVKIDLGFSLKRFFLYEEFISEGSDTEISTTEVLYTDCYHHQDDCLLTGSALGTQVKIPKPLAELCYENGEAIISITSFSFLFVAVPYVASLCTGIASFFPEVADYAFLKWFIGTMKLFSLPSFRHDWEKSRLAEWGPYLGRLYLWVVFLTIGLVGLSTLPFWDQCEGQIDTWFKKGDIDGDEKDQGLTRHSLIAGNSILVVVGVYNFLHIDYYYQCMYLEHQGDLVRNAKKPEGSKRNTTLSPMQPV